ncbi:GFA family protein [Dongia rigui]|uniref:GFA family protein n=1 Tax=Dongia rigui TaxID=940149 RepID=A0ABU5E3D6_9PROT|nr:GFA family protein [Dongia rigui]MDY0874125.1 GFA family protein [Dongia rigui]
MSHDTYHGHCLCGAVSFEIEGPLTVPAACHCAMCRRWHGALGVYTSVPAARLKLTNSEQVVWYRSSNDAERGFCRTCGSKLFWRNVGSDGLDITMGVLDGPSNLQVSKHIWVAFKGDYYDIVDDLPQFSQSSAKAAPCAPAPAVGAPEKRQSHHGRCLCGAVDLTVNGKLRDISQCHCSQCRRWHGHAPAYSKAYWADITLNGGEHVRWYQSSDQARRGFCDRCGSSLFWERSGADAVSIPAGVFDAPVSPRQRHHIFVADKGDYYQIPDKLPQYPGSGGAALPF